jgi:hypothetical protein
MVLDDTSIDRTETVPAAIEVFIGIITLSTRGT